MGMLTPTNYHKQPHDTLFMNGDKFPAVALHTFHALRRKTKALSITFRPTETDLQCVCGGETGVRHLPRSEGSKEPSGNRTVTAATDEQNTSTTPASDSTAA